MIPEFHPYPETIIWDESTGLSPEELELRLREIDARPTDCYADVKTELIEFILDNARLASDPYDIFPEKLGISNIAFKIRWDRRRALETTDMKPALDRVAEHNYDKAFNADTDFGHIAPDWDFLMKNGLTGMISTIEDRLSRENEPKKRRFYENSLRCWRAIVRFALRYADKKEREGCEFAARNLRALTLHAPSTLAEAMQLTFLVYTIQTDVETCNIRSLGRLDRLYFPFFRADLDSGRLTLDDVRLLLRHFIGRIAPMKVTANLPIALGGLNADGSDASNDLTRLFLEVYDSLDVHDPKFHVLHHPSIRRDIVNLALDMIRRGRNSIVFLNCSTVEKALIRIGITPEDARDFLIYGCYEAGAAGKEFPATCAGRVNLPKAIEMTLAESHEDFDSFLSGLKANIALLLTECMDTIAAWEHYYDCICPAPILSSTFASCREKGIDIFEGGAVYNNTSIVASCTASLVDMTAAVKTVVYDEKLVTLTGLRKVLAANFEGYEKLRKYCIERTPKFGCGDDFADQLAADLSDFIADTINGRPNGRGGIFRCGMFSIDYRMFYGKRLGATPDGRLAGEPLSKNFNACLGMDKNGVTAMIKSAGKIDCTQVPDGCVLDPVLHPSAVKGEEGLAAMHALLNAYFALGGFAIQFNVLDADILRRAQREPDKFRNLQVRLCGWNVYFVNLSKVEQDEFILQAEKA